MKTSKLHIIATQELTLYINFLFYYNVPSTTDRMNQKTRHEIKDFITLYTHVCFECEEKLLDRCIYMPHILEMSLFHH